MKTLVIHPCDPTTEFLKIIYKDIEHTLVDNFKPGVGTSKSELKELIKSHDRIIMLGHGTEEGLINPQTSTFFQVKFILDSSWVYLLREKEESVYIWCMADKFVERYKLKGFYTGMIISEWQEAQDFINHFNYSHEDIEYSNKLFATVIGKVIERRSQVICEEVKTYYKSPTNNAIIDFNKQNIYFL